MAYIYWMLQVCVPLSRIHSDQRRLFLAQPSPASQLRVLRRFAVVEASSDIGEDENGRVIWMWRDPLSPSLADTVSQKPKSFTADSRIFALHTCSSLSSRVIVAGYNGGLTILDLDLNVKHKTGISEALIQCLYSYVFSKDVASFVPSASWSRNAAVVVLLVKTTEGLEAEVLLIDEGDSCTSIGRKHIVKNALHVTCSESGYISTLSQDGSWQSYQIGFELA
ncbi:hypothetical protein BDN72DRAFT_965323, partial [Pluteus cervinus]